MSDVVVYLIPPCVFGAAFFAGYRMGRRKNRLSFGLIALIWVGLSWSILAGARSQSGFGGIGDIVLLVGVNAPLGAGVLIGGVAGWIRKRE